jgi:hypothetical protein
LSNYLPHNKSLESIKSQELIINTVELTHENKIDAVKQYFNDINWDLSDYNCEVGEYWLVSEWLANKLEDKSEPIEKDFMG